MKTARLSVQFVVLSSLVILLGNTIGSSQNCTALYGLTYSGGEDNLGVLFHLEPGTHYQVIDYSFPVENPGATPYGDLADGGNGKLYGLTSKGGIYHMGVIFEWDLINNTYTSKFDFAGLSTGAFPCGSLILYNQKFYGLATGGGQNGYGAIFEWDPQTNFFSKKANFSQTTSGAYPYGSLSIKDGKFYGMTRFGGIYNCGVLFEWDPITNILSKKVDFDDVNTGEMPTNGYLTLYNEKFYGMTFMGGAYHDGVIFEWDPGTNIFTKKVDLETSQGARPLGSLTLKDGKFYGMTHFGGYSGSKMIGSGVIFEWDPATNIYSKKIEFTDDGIDGCEPYGSLTLHNGKFYGMTSSGGNFGEGIIFEWDPDSNIFTRKWNFDYYTSGSYPIASLLFSNGKFYGMAPEIVEGLIMGSGVIFEWDPVSNTIPRKIFLQDSPNGKHPTGSLTVLDGKIYGMTPEGGANRSGVIFEWDPVNHVFSKKADFSPLVTGRLPYGSLSVFNGKLYGMTYAGGANYQGVLFEWDPVNNTLTNKHDFIESTGFEPYGSLNLHREKFYGITYSGYNSKAAIFEWDPQTNIYSKQVDFNAPVTGNRPHGYMTFCDGSFYGMTEDGGSLNGGTLFEWNPMSNLLTSRIDFNGYNGCNPLGSLTHNDGKLYGLTCFGGELGCGNLFEWDPATDIFLSKIGFDDVSRGGNPLGSLILSYGKFYGMTYGGGLYGNGTIFEWDLSDNSFVKLLDFDGVNGGTPWYSELTEFNYSPSSTTWTGLVNSDWLNIDNWNPCIPQSNTNVIIPSDAFNFPTITVPVSCAGLTIENGASFIGSEFLNVPAGAVQIKRNITDTKSHYLSSPVSNSTFGGVFSTSHAVWAREYVTNNDSWIYRFLIDPFVIGKGYCISTTTPPVVANFSSVSATINAPPVIVMNLSHDNDGWNLLGNPYPSSLDWNFVDLLNVNPSVAVWDGTNLLGQLQPGYRYYNKNTGVGIPETFNGIIPPENGFFVSATGISASITMPGYARVHSSTSLFKVTKTDLLRLHVEGNSLQDEMIIHFDNNATPGFDDFDGKKIESEINLYSIVDGYRFWLNTIPLESNDYVSIGFSASLPGNFDLFASGFDSFKVSTPLFLEDLKTNKIYDLNQDSKYSFYYDINDNAQRFRLYFSNCPDMQNEATNGISIYCSENLVYIINKSQISGDFWIHDIGGREVLHGTLSNQYKTCIPLKVSAGTYLVKVVNNQGLSFKKIMIR